MKYAIQINFDGDWLWQQEFSEYTESGGETKVRTYESTTEALESATAQELKEGSFKILAYEG